MDYVKYKEHQGEVTAKQLEDMPIVDESEPDLLPKNLPAFLVVRAQRNLRAIQNYVNADSHILDIGCRTGVYLLFLKHHGFKNLWGIEIHKESVEFAKKRKLNVIEGDIHALFYDDHSFDAVNCTQVFEHTHDPEMALCEIKRVLKDDGVLWIDIPLEGRQAYDEEFNHAGHHNYWGSPDEIGKLLNKFFSLLDYQIYLYPPDVNGKVWAQGVGFLCQNTKTKEGKNDKESS
jgi:SAM-dependent methyltransferase